MQFRSLLLASQRNGSNHTHRQRGWNKFSRMSASSCTSARCCPHHKGMAANTPTIKRGCYKFAGVHPRKRMHHGQSQDRPQFLLCRYSPCKRWTHPSTYQPGACTYQRRASRATKYSGSNSSIVTFSFAFTRPAGRTHPISVKAGCSHALASELGSLLPSCSPLRRLVLCLCGLFLFVLSHCLLPDLGLHHLF